jgi:hypothetical protein
MRCWVIPLRRHRRALAVRSSVAQSKATIGNRISAAVQAAMQVMDMAKNAVIHQRRTRPAGVLASYRIGSASASLHAEVCVQDSPGRTSCQGTIRPGWLGPQRTRPCRSASAAVGRRSRRHSVTDPARGVSSGHGWACCAGRSLGACAWVSGPSVWCLTGLFWPWTCAGISCWQGMDRVFPPAPTPHTTDRKWWWATGRRRGRPVGRGAGTGADRGASAG